jgi:hypothetical protein
MTSDWGIEKQGGNGFSFEEKNSVDTTAAVIEAI